MSTRKNAFIVQKAQRLVSKASTQQRERRERPNLRKKTTEFYRDGRWKAILRMIRDASGEEIALQPSFDQHQNSMLKLSRRSVGRFRMPRPPWKSVIKYISRRKWFSRSSSGWRRIRPKVSSWTYAAIRSVFLFSTDALSFMFQRMLEGKLKREFWVMRRSVLIPRMGALATALWQSGILSIAFWERF